MNRPRKLRQERSRALMILVGFMWFVGTVTASGDPDLFDYKVLATNRTSTMQKELAREGENGFKLAGMTVSRTTFGGEELVSILQRPAR